MKNKKIYILLFILMFTPIKTAFSQWVVFDPTNFVENVLQYTEDVASVTQEAQQYAEQVEQYGEQVETVTHLATQIQNQIQMLRNDALNLKNLGTDKTGSILSQIERINNALGAVKGLAYGSATVTQDFDNLFPKSVTFDGSKGSQDAFNKYFNKCDDNIRNQSLDTFNITSNLYNGNKHDFLGNVKALLTGGKSASGNLSIGQASNQLHGQLNQAIHSLNAVSAAFSRSNSAWIANAATKNKLQESFLKHYLAKDGDIKIKTYTTGILQDVHDAFTAALTLGIDKEKPYAMNLLKIFACMEIIFFGLWYAANDNPQIKEALLLVIKIGILIFFVSNWDYLINILGKSFEKLGLIAGGGKITTADFESPTQIMNFGAKIYTWMTTGHSQSWFSHITHPSLFIGQLAGLVVFVCFFIIAIQVVIIWIEFWIVAFAALILLPLGVFRYTKDLGSRSIPVVVAYGIKLLCLAFLISLSFPLIKFWEGKGIPGEVLQFMPSMYLLCGVLCLTYIIIKIPNIVASCFGGSLTSADGVGPVMAAGTAVTMVASNYIKPKVQKAGAAIEQGARSLASFARKAT